jgi:hypothetical protein
MRFLPSCVRRLSILVVLAAGICSASDAPTSPVATIDWAKLQEAKALKIGEVVTDQEDHVHRLKIENTKTGFQSIPLCEIVSPKITTPSYAVRGKIRYENVVGNGFLEMWNHFSGAGQYFSRTLDTSGPMGMITGTSPEREFILPFHTLRQTSAPTKLVINLVLNGPGTVEIGPLELVPIDEMTAMADGDWWSGQTGGLIGGLGGSMLGLLGALIGTLSGMGKGRRLVLVLSAITAAVGSGVLILGIVAISTGQSYNVYYPLLLLGGMMCLGGIISLCVSPARFRSHELRRMQALDLS